MKGILTIVCTLPFLLLSQGLSEAMAVNCYTYFYDLGEPLPVFGDFREMANLTPYGPPPDPQVGDEWLWYCWDLSGYPTAELKPCTVRGRGDNIYVVVENSQWNVNVDQTDVDQILLWFDDESLGDFPDAGVWELNTETFGEPPDFDGLSRIFYMYLDFNQPGADGFFWWYDQYPDGTQDFASNECDVIYLNCAVADPGSAYLNAVGAHEFEHLIHFNYDMYEDTWVDEGCAELAMWLFGNPDSISGFPGNPDNNLTEWSGEWADYIKTYLWTLYIYEHYGEYISTPLINTLVSETAHGVTGVNNALADCGYSQTMADVFNDWVVANYLDDTTVGDGQYGYDTEDLPSFHCVSTWDDFPVDQNGSLNHWAGEYIMFVSGGVWFGLGGDFTGQSSADYILRSIKTSGASPTTVEEIDLDEDNHGEFTYDDFGSDYDQILLVPINRTLGVGTNTYSYTADSGEVDVELLYFTAEPEGEGAIVLKWGVETTEAEEILGYNLYRREIETTLERSSLGGKTKDALSAEWMKLNTYLIVGDSPYSFVDEGVEARTAYEYKLEAVLESSAETLGTTQVTAGLPPASFAILALYPNPASDTLTCLFAVPDAGAVELALYDLSGRLVIERRIEVTEPSEIKVLFDVSGLASGVYTLRASSGGAEVSPACGGVAVVIH